MSAAIKYVETTLKNLPGNTTITKERLLADAPKKMHRGTLDEAVSRCLVRGTILRGDNNVLAPAPILRQNVVRLHGQRRVSYRRR